MIEILKELLLPSRISALLLFAGLICTLVGSLRNRSRYLLLCGAGVYLVFSNGLVAAALIGPLEHRYPAMLEPQDYPQIDTVVVLTSYAANDKSMPLSSRAGSSAIYRVLEASRLYSEGSVRKIIVSGESPAADIMAEILIVAGVAENSILVDNGAQHTSDSAIRLKADLDGKAFFLVTSAGHLPRALGVFRAQGTKPVPAPTDYQLPRQWSSASFWPSPFHLNVSDLAIREYSGLLWYRASGKTEQFW